MDILEKERVVKKNILHIFKESFNVTKTDDEILDIKPEKEFDLNCIGYYESILDIFLIDHEHLDSITGKVKDTIKKVAKLWVLTPHSAPPWKLQ